MRARHAVSGLLTLVLACSRDAGDHRDAAGATGAVVPPDSLAAHDTMAGMSNMPGMANMTGDPDHDFLRMMSDHHKGLVQVVHEATKKGGSAVKSEAREIDRKQDADLDTMATILDEKYKDAYTPTASPDNTAARDSIGRLSGAAFDRAFREFVISHHARGIAMMDEYLAKAKDTRIKAMATRMRADQQKEIASFRATLSGTK